MACGCTGTKSKNISVAKRVTPSAAAPSPKRAATKATSPVTRKRFPARRKRAAR